VQIPDEPVQPPFACEPLDDPDAAPVRYVNVVELPCTPAALFAVLEDADAWPRWAPGIAEVAWTSPRPFGVGTTRTVTFWGGMDVFERFTAWEHGRRLGFTFEGTTELVWRRFAERYDVDDLGDGRCRLTWTVGYEPAGGFGRWHALIRPAMALNFRLYMALLRRYVRGRA
jgi:hypothetical protein